jgi:hypothetical protein
MLLVVARFLQGLAGDGRQFGVARFARRCHISLSQVDNIRLRRMVKAKSPRGNSARVGLR